MQAFESMSPQELEVQFLETLRPQYEKRGFRFIVMPDRQLLPKFLGSYRPDALAQRPGENIAIEVKQRQSRAGGERLAELNKLFEGHTDWIFQVVYSGSSQDSMLAIKPVSEEDLEHYLSRVETLKGYREYQAAFIMSWSLLEASLRTLNLDISPKPLTPGSVVQALIMNGYLDDEDGRQLKPLIELRNRIVHGDFGAHVSARDVDAVLDGVRLVLAGPEPEVEVSPSPES